MLVEMYWPLALGLILMAGFGAWVFLHSNRSYLLRWALIPVALVVAVLSAKLYGARLGYAVAAELPEKFVYLAHQMVVEKNRKCGIEVWARTGRPGSTGFPIPSRPRTRWTRRANSLRAASPW